MARQIVGAAILAVLALMIARPLEANAEDLRTWRHGLLDPKSDAGFSHMITQGFAEKQGLKLEVFHFQADTQLLQALIAGQLDSFEGSPGNDIMARRTVQTLGSLAAPGRAFLM